MSVLQSGITKSLAEAYTIDQSVRFDDGDSPSLTKTFASAGDRKTWTFSAWVKLGLNGEDRSIFTAGPDSNDTSQLLIRDDDKLYFFSQTGSVDTQLLATPLYRDPSAWYHIVCKYDSTPATPDSTDVALFVNGSQVTAFDIETYPSQNDDTHINDDVAHYISRRNYDDAAHWDGYIAEVYFIDGLALDADSFGETDSTTNQWKPIDASGLTFGTNGFYQKYAGTELATDIVDAREPAQFVSSEDLTCDILIVAGGGSGDSVSYAGGGGGGGMRAITDITATSGTSYPIKVGKGAHTSWHGNVEIGQDSSALGYTSTGGGTGGKQGGTARSGGSGGGAGGNTTPAGSGNTPSTSPSQGADGGTGASSGYGGAGGGGGGGGASGSTGSNGTIGEGPSNAGNGGAGTSNDYRTGSGVTYAGGGGGSCSSDGTQTLGTGGTGGGGNGESKGVSAATAGTANTGGGGGGGTGLAGGVGGSGIIVIRYLSASAKATGGTITTYGSGGSQYYVHSFTDAEDAPLAITKYGDIANTMAYSKVGDSSIAYDGTGDYMTLAAGVFTDGDYWNFNHDYYTAECWFYVNAITGNDQIMGITNDPYDGWNIQVDDSGPTVGFQIGGGGSWDIDTVTSGGYSISTGQWYHVALVRQLTAWTLYVDGTSRLTGTADVSNYGGRKLYIGNGGSSGGDEFNGYMDEIRVSDVARYTGTFTPQTTEFTVDSNTFLLIHSNWDGGFGGDSSGNYNTFTATNLVATDQMVDSPTNNFCTINTVVKTYNDAVVYSEGNLKVAAQAATWGASPLSQSRVTGKWYFEIYYSNDTGDAYTYLGICGDNSTQAFQGTDSSPIGSADILYYGNDGTKNIDGTPSSYGDSFDAGDIIGVALNLDDSEVTFYNNNVAQDSGTPISFSGSITSASSVIPLVINTQIDCTLNAGSDSSFAGVLTAQGNADSEGVGDFYYAPPADYLSLCSSNLPDPSIKLPGENFNSVLYTGNAASTHAITGVGFQPDFTWLKKREDVDKHILSDAVRTATYYVSSNSTAAEVQEATSLKSFDTDGFSVGDWDDVNGSGSSFVSWNWLAATTFDPADDGTIVTASGRSNSTAGFSIVEYTGTGSTVTIGHGLASKPDLIIVKGLGTTGWPTYQSPQGATYVLFLDDTGASTNVGVGGYWGDTEPDASVFTVEDSSQTNNTGVEYISYIFHSVESYSKVGVYEGNGNADGTFIYTGFRPEYFLTKNIDAVEAWAVWDSAREPYNKLSKKLSPNTTDAEYTANTTTYAIDFVSNGVKLRSSYSVLNSTATFLWMAFAEFPFKYANAR